MAKLAETAERFKDMVMFLTRVVEIGTGLDEVERNLLSVAYKCYIGSRRTAWRAIKNVEQKEAGKQKEKLTQYHVDNYRLSIEDEMRDICRDCLGLLDKYLLP